MCYGVSSEVCVNVGQFSKWGIGSLMLASKPDIAFETVSRCVTRLTIVHHQWHTTSLQMPG